MRHLDAIAARQRLCRETGLVVCNRSMPISNFPFRHGLRRLHHPRLDQSIDAIIYVTVVFVLFAAIILLLVSTNCRRFQSPEEQPSPQAQKATVVRFREKTALVSTETLPRDLV
ncbi:unnamed protein product [Ixodes persulcatus]